ncbi:hypothetical protein Tco_0455636 [Tanacetum coccineum]
MPTATSTGMTQDAINELITKRVDEALKAYDAARSPETKAEIKNEQQDDHVEENVNNENGNRNGNGNPNVNNGGVVPVARECMDILKITRKQSKTGKHGHENQKSTKRSQRIKAEARNIKPQFTLLVTCTSLFLLVQSVSAGTLGTEGVVGLTRWFEKMEAVFYISNCPPRYQVKYATYTLLDGALTWWNSHKRTIGVDDAYAMTWKALMKLMTERFQELTLLCTKMVPEEDDKVEKLQDAIRVANNLMDQKLKGYVIKNAKNKRRFESSSRDNRRQQQQQQPFKRQNVNGQNVARAYTVKNNVKRKGYAGVLLYCNK